MPKLIKLLSGVAAAATLAAITAAPAMADPIGSNGKSVVPQSYDVVGVGSNTTQYVLDQISVDYNKTIPASKHSASHPYFYTWDAVKPGSSSSVPTKIVPKAGCKSITRPNGSTAGLNALKISQQIAGGHYCVDFGRSSSGRSSSAPGLGPGGVSYVAFATDAVTWATRAANHGGSDAPASLTLAQLKGIFTCQTTNWNQVGGKNGAIKVYLPQPGSGTLSFWEKVMGITTLGSCVDQHPEENEGTYSGFNNKNAIFIFSIGSYIAEKYHSAACGKTPTGTQNKFGCNTIGVLGINKISGVAPTTTAAVPVTNPNFPSAFHRTLYNILRWTTTSDHIPSNLEPIFARSHAKVKGYLCTNATAIKDIKNYGFIPTNLCGSIS
ncbi:MAG TPA: substrate-binding domain-containing protein [Streptosporangiaceae bacterium]|jgi:ABC-type phosphate transport system substrate-binding protein|nr:substrate-binding domain-containing protein [Streptosporangiaceae bacterium]